MKHGAQKVRRLYEGKILAGFAGATADAFTLFELFEAKLKELRGNMDINTTICVADLKLPENVTAIYDQNFAVVSVLSKAKDAEGEGEGAE